MGKLNKKMEDLIIQVQYGFIQSGGTRDHIMFHNIYKYIDIEIRIWNILKEMGILYIKEQNMTKKYHWQAAVKECKLKKKHGLCQMTWFHTLPHTI
jgi:hypothetical protein